jgi:hypothetical protein
MDLFTGEGGGVVNGRGMKQITHHHLVPRSWMSGAIHLLPLYACMAWVGIISSLLYWPAISLSDIRECKATTWFVLARSNTPRSFRNTIWPSGVKQLTPLLCYYKAWFLFPKAGIMIIVETLNQVVHLVIQWWNQDNLKQRDYLNNLYRNLSS